MNLKDDIKSVTELKVQPAALIDAINQHHRPLVITQNGQARAVLQDIASYESTRKALLLLKLVAQGEADIKNKKVFKQQDVFARLNRKLERRG